MWRLLSIRNLSSIPLIDELSASRAVLEAELSEYQE